MNKIKLTNSDVNRLMNQNCNAIAKKKTVYYLGKKNEEDTKKLKSSTIKKLKTIAMKIYQDNQSDFDKKAMEGVYVLIIEYTPRNVYYNYTLIKVEELRNNVDIYGLNIYPFIITNCENYTEKELKAYIKDVVEYPNVQISKNRLQNISSINDLIELYNNVGKILESDTHKTIDSLKLFCADDRIDNVLESLAANGFKTNSSCDYSLNKNSENDSQVVDKQIAKGAELAVLDTTPQGIFQLNAILPKNVRCPICKGKLLYIQNTNPNIKNTENKRNILRCNKCNMDAQVEEGASNYLVKSTFAPLIVRRKRKYCHSMIDEVVVPNIFETREEVYAWMRKTVFPLKPIEDVHIGNLRENSLNTLAYNLITLINENHEKVMQMPELSDTCYNWLDTLVMNGTKFKNILKKYVDENNKSKKIIDIETKIPVSNIEEPKTEDAEDVEDIKPDNSPTSDNSIESIIRKMIREEINLCGGVTNNSETNISKEINTIKEELEAIKKELDDLNCSFSNLSGNHTYVAGQYTKMSKEMEKLKNSIDYQSERVKNLEQFNKDIPTNRTLAKQLIQAAL